MDVGKQDMQRVDVTDTEEGRDSEIKADELLWWPLKEAAGKKKYNCLFWEIKKHHLDL